MLSAADRARRAVTHHAKVGFENLRSALVDEPEIDPELPAWPEGQELEAERVMVLPDAEQVGATRDGELAGATKVSTVGAGSDGARPRSSTGYRGPRTRRPPGRHASA
jgi:hypothetical protein